MNPEYIISSDSLKFRRSNINDINYIVNAEQDDVNRAYITPWSISQHEASFRNPDCLHIIIENHNNQQIGFIIIMGMDNINKNIELLRIVITDKGKGYGKESIGMIQEFVFNQLNAHRLWLDVKECNERARIIYEKMGFQIDGRLRECIKTLNGYETLYIMSILESEYEKHNESRS